MKIFILNPPNFHIFSNGALFAEWTRLETGPLNYSRALGNDTCVALLGVRAPSGQYLPPVKKKDFGAYKYLVDEAYIETEVPSRMVPLLMRHNAFVYRLQDNEDMIIKTFGDAFSQIGNEMKRASERFLLYQI